MERVQTDPQIFQKGSSQAVWGGSPPPILV